MHIAIGLADAKSTIATRMKFAHLESLLKRVKKREVDSQHDGVPGGLSEVPRKPRKSSRGIFCIHKTPIPGAKFISPGQATRSGAQPWETTRMTFALKVTMEKRKGQLPRERMSCRKVQLVKYERFQNSFQRRSGHEQAYTGGL
jgi:hypothetical protein